MKKKLLFILVVIIALISVMLVGCAKNKTMPFAQSPEHNIKINYMEEIVENTEQYEEMYKHYKLLRVGGLMSEDLELFLNNLEKEYSEEEEVYGKFVDNGEKYVLMQLVLENLQSKLDAEAKKIVDSYLKHTRLGEKETDLYLSKELEEHNPVGAVKKYMEENEIVVEEIILPETFEDTNYNIFPMKYTYRYVLKGTVGKKPFEKEVVQDFYIGWNWTEGIESIYDVIEYIRDVSEETPEK